MTSSSNLLKSCDANQDPYVTERPKKYHDVVLPSNWYLVGMKKKKKSERQNHGVISFKSLSKTIGARWKSADEEVKTYCKKIGAEELRKYRINQASYKEKYGKDAFESQKRTYKKRSNTNSDNSGGKRNKEGNKNNEDDCTGYGESNVSVQDMGYITRANECESRDEGANDKDKMKRRGSEDSSQFSVCEWLDIGQVAVMAFCSDDE
jgi:hypothetical protein